MVAKDIHGWVEEVCKPLLGYTPIVYTLVKGWHCFFLNSSKDVAVLMERVWNYINGSIMLKRWTHLFNPEMEHFCFRHLWVLMLGFPLAFGNLEMFKEIGDAIDKFLDVGEVALAY